MFFPNSSMVALQGHGVHVYDKTVYHLRELETKISPYRCQHKKGCVRWELVPRDRFY